MSYLKSSTPIITQRDKNQITIPSGITKNIGATKGSKYKAIINTKGNIELMLLKDNIGKYKGSINTNESAVDLIRKERSGDESKSDKVYE